MQLSVQRDGPDRRVGERTQGVDRPNFLVGNAVGTKPSPRRDVLGRVVLQKKRRMVTVTGIVVVGCHRSNTKSCFNSNEKIVSMYLFLSRREREQSYRCQRALFVFVLSLAWASKQTIVVSRSSGSATHVRLRRRGASGNHDISQATREPTIYWANYHGVSKRTHRCRSPRKPRHRRLSLCYSTVVDAENVDLILQGRLSYE